MADGKDGSHPDTTVSLFGASDPRYGELSAAILNTLRERGQGLLFVGILGALRLAENQFIHEAREDQV